MYYYILVALLVLVTTTHASPLTSSLALLSKHNIPHAQVVYLDAQDLRSLGLNLSQRLALRQHISNTQDFAFVISHFNSTRQWGKCLNIVIKYRYVLGTDANSTGGGYLDYREMREMALKVAQPTEQLPMEVQWEAINTVLVEQIMQRYSSQIVAVSSLIQVMAEMNTYIDEPGNHGSIVTRGDISPTNEPWINNFRYDCTSQNGTVRRLSTQQYDDTLQ